MDFDKRKGKAGYSAVTVYIMFLNLIKNIKEGRHKEAFVYYKYLVAVN